MTDSSTDGSADVVIPYENRGVRVIKQKNSGVSAARNRGVSASTGGWIAFLDADDLWLPNHLECLTRVIEAYPNVGLVSTQHEILDSGVRFRTRSTYRSGVVCLVDDFYTRLANGLSLVNSSTACVRREAIEAIGGFPSNIHVGETLFYGLNYLRNSVWHTSQKRLLFTVETL